MSKERLQKEVKIRLISVLDFKEENLEEVMDRMELLTLNKRLFFWFASILFIVCFLMAGLSMIDIDWFEQRWVKAGIPLAICGGIMIQGWHFLPRDYAKTNYKRVLLTCQKMLEKESETKVHGYIKSQLSAKEQRIVDASRKAEDMVCRARDAWERWVRVAWFCIIINGSAGLLAIGVPEVAMLWKGGEWVSLFLLILPALIFWRLNYYRRKEQVLFFLRLLRMKDS